MQSPLPRPCWASTQNQLNCICPHSKTMSVVQLPEKVRRVQAVLPGKVRFSLSVTHVHRAAKLMCKTPYQVQDTALPCELMQAFPCTPQTSSAFLARLSTHIYYTLLTFYYTSFSKESNLLLPQCLYQTPYNGYVNVGLSVTLCFLPLCQENITSPPSPTIYFSERVHSRIT